MAAHGAEFDTHSYLVQGTKFEVPDRYTALEPAYLGAWACVAQDEKTEGQVEIRKTEHVFEHVVITKRALRELRILRHLQHSNLVRVLDVFFGGSKEDFEEIYIVSEHMEGNLAHVIRGSEPLTDEHCQHFLYQILRGMKYVHSAHVIHRDLKPWTLLVNARCDLKIRDFSSSRMSLSGRESQAGPLTEYVGTFCYRAPELLCASAEYTAAVDVWSIACVFAEMLLRQRLFHGYNTRQQLELIVGLLGSPASSELQRIRSAKCRALIEAMPSTAGEPLRVRFSDAPPAAIDLLQKTLRFDPDRRLSVAEALQQSYLEQLHCPDDEPVCACPPHDVSEFEFERREVGARYLREQLLLEVLRYHPDRRVRFLQEQKLVGQMYNIEHYWMLVPGEYEYSSEEEEP